MDLLKGVTRKLQVGAEATSTQHVDVKGGEPHELVRKVRAQPKRITPMMSAKMVYAARHE